MTAKFDKGDCVEVVGRGYGIVTNVTQKMGACLYTVELTLNRRPRDADESKTIVFVLEGGLAKANPDAEA